MCVKRVSWANATDLAKENYQDVLTDKLNSISIPLSKACSNLQCKTHRDDIETYTLDVLEAVESAGQKCLPSTGGVGRTKSGSKKVPGQSEFVKPYAEDNKFSSDFWRTHGKPKNGPIFEYMKHSRKQYSYAVRRLKRCNDVIQNKKFLEGLLNIDGQCDIFQEIRKLRAEQKL